MDVDVCIVGGGPAGMLLANLLAERGQEVLVLEKSPDFEREFRGEVLQPRFMRALAQVGLDAFILEQPHERFDLCRFYKDGEQIGAFRFQQVDPEHPFVMWMTQPILLRALWQRAQTFASFDIWFEARAHELLIEDGAVVGVRVHRETENGREEVDVRARLVVGADGRFSTMAKLGEFEIEYEHYPFDVLWFHIERPADAVNQVSFYISRDAGYISLPKYPDLFQIGMMMTPGAFKNFRAQGIDSIRKELRRAHPWFAAFADKLEDFSEFHVLQAKCAYRKQWARDGLLLIGDAAHTCSPIGAIGVAVAIETALVAADVILAHPSDRPFDRAVLDQVQARRNADVRKIHRMQMTAGDNFVSQSPLARIGRPLAVRIGSATGLLPKIGARLVTRRDPLPLTVLGRPKPA
jgi:2-polyprenyl-6-methoxyphenol hydroxylase-like FAD-dependent oxidoreductase